MAKLNHTIVAARDREASAKFLSEMLGLDPPQTLGHFTMVTGGEDLTLDYMESETDFVPQHYAFLVSEDEFDQILDRIRRRSLNYWADPMHRKPGQINRWDDGRGLYFNDPNGHSIEVLTRPYGSGGTEAEHPNPLLIET